MREQRPALDRWETRILDAVRDEGMREKAIAKRIRLDEPVVADLITGLMLKVIHRKEKAEVDAVLFPRIFPDYF